MYIYISDTFVIIKVISILFLLYEIIAFLFQCVNL